MGKSHSTNVFITAHALLRWLQRVRGFSFDEDEREIQRRRGKGTAGASSREPARGIAAAALCGGAYTLDVGPRRNRQAAGLPRGGAAPAVKISICFLFSSRRAPRAVP